MNDDTGDRSGLRLTWLTVFAAAAALTVAGCGGGGGAPPVASLGNGSDPGASGGAGSTSVASNTAPATRPDGVTPLLNQWAACERGNGDPQQTDPTVSAGAVIYITIPQGAQYAGNIYELTGACAQYLAQAQNELRAANPEPPAPGPGAEVKFVNCMRANGVPD